VPVVQGDGGDVQTIDLDAVAVGADQLDADFFVDLEGRDVDTGRRGRERRKSNEGLVGGRLWYCWSSHRRSLSSEIRSWQHDISTLVEKPAIAVHGRRKKPRAVLVRYSLLRRIGRNFRVSASRLAKMNIFWGKCQ
jgi:hypothetical protein